MVAQNNSTSSDNRLVQYMWATGPVHLVQLGAECNHVTVVRPYNTGMAKVTAKNADSTLKIHPLVSHQLCDMCL